MGNKPKKKSQINKKQTAKTEKTKWYLNKKVLWVTAPILFVTGISLIFYSSMDNNMVGLLIGIALIPSAGLLITPKIISSALNESRSWRDRVFRDGLLRDFKKDILKEKIFREAEDPSAYHEKIVGAVRKNTMKNIIALAVIVIAIVIGGLFLFANGIDFDSPRYRDVHTPRQETEVYVETFFLVIGAIIFLFPIFSYSLTCVLYRSYAARRGEYLVYRTVVRSVENSELLIWGKHSYKFKYCTCIGIREKDVNNTKAILVFVPDEVYLIPDDDVSKDDIDAFKYVVDIDTNKK